MIITWNVLSNCEIIRSKKAYSKNEVRTTLLKNTTCSVLVVVNLNIHTRCGIICKMKA